MRRATFLIVHVCDGDAAIVHVCDGDTAIVHVSDGDAAIVHVGDAAIVPCQNLLEFVTMPMPIHTAAFAMAVLCY